MKKGGNLPCIMNAANEIAVEAFLHEKIRFLNIPEVIEKSMERITFVKEPSLDDYIATDADTRIYTRELIEK